MIVVAINEGINSSVVVTQNGRVLFALQEERINRIKNFMGFPHEALGFTLEHLRLNPTDLEAVCLSNLVSPIVTKEEFAHWYEVSADLTMAQIREPRPSVLRGMRSRRQERAAVQRSGAHITASLARHSLDALPAIRTHHHLNHAASAYFGLRDDSETPHLVVTLDGGGDGDCAHVYRVQDGTFELLARTPEGNSVGNIYSRITHLLGMTPHEHEYKLMGLAPYPDPEYAAPLIDIFRRYLVVDPANPLVFTRTIPESTFAIGPRLGRDFRRARFDTLAAAIQGFTEELVVEWIRACIRTTGIPRVVAAGGVFMNVKVNKLISELPEVEFFDVFPSCGDETLPFGAAWLYHSKHSTSHGADITFDSFCLGPDASHDLPEAQRRYAGEVVFRALEDPEAEIGRLVAGGATVARCTGPMEFGARALGNRSLLADPGRWAVVQEINKMIKQRDFWMPFAPAILRESVSEYLHIAPSLPRERISPYMMHAFDTTPSREDFPAAIHPYDRTARAQVVVEDQSPGFHRVLSEFRRRTGKGVVLNTSFNLHGSPIVVGACDAIHVLLNSSLRYLVIDNVLVEKAAQAGISAEAELSTQPALQPSHPK